MRAGGWPVTLTRPLTVVSAFQHDPPQALHHPRTTRTARAIKALIPLSRLGSETRHANSVKSQVRVQTNRRSPLQKVKCECVEKPIEDVSMDVRWILLQSENGTALRALDFESRR